MKEASTPEMSNPKEWVTEDALDTICRCEELFLTLVHGVMKRLGNDERARVNRKAVASLLRLYRKHGRVFETGASSPPLPIETIEALMWADAKAHGKEQSLSDLVH
jgi:hypothetical protein